jgi:hypothetical protein
MCVIIDELDHFKGKFVKIMQIFCQKSLTLIRIWIRSDQ